MNIEDSFRKKDIQHREELLKNFNTTFTRLYNAEHELGDILGTVGENIKVAPPLHVENGSNIFLGNNVHINIGTKIRDNGGIVQFGDRVLTGPYLEVITARKNEDQPIERGDVIIEPDVWIGGGVKIFPGVTIGEGSVIAAGSQIESDIPANVLAVGFPARPIKEINIAQKGNDLTYLKQEPALPRIRRGEIFYTSAPDAVETKRQAYEFFSDINRRHTYLTRAETELSRVVGSTGRNIDLYTPFYFSYGSQIFLGNDVTFQDGVFLGDAGKITIGDGATLGSEVQIYTTNHLLDKDERIYIEPKDVFIGKQVRIGKGAIILPGVIIGDRTQIADGSVVKDNIPAGAFAAGIPAKIQR